MPHRRVAIVRVADILHVIGALTVAVLLAIGATLFRMALQAFAGRKPHAAFADIWLDTIARTLSVSVRDASRVGAGCPMKGGRRGTSAERVLLVMLSAVAMLVSVTFSGAFIQSLMFDGGDNMNRIEELRATGLPVMVPDEYVNTLDWWRDR